MKGEIKMEKEKKLPSLPVAFISLVLIIGIIISAILLGASTQMSLFIASVMAISIALLLGNEWKDIQEKIINFISEVMVALLVVTIIGIIVGVWIIGGTVPALLYYGLNFINPSFVLALTFLLCMMTSIFIGTSFGSIATMGIATMGIGLSVGIPAPMLAGAIASGAFFGDKMSPMSGTTNVTAGIGKVQLYEHIVSMMYTTMPATVVTLIVYIILGLNYTASSANTENVNLILTTLKNNYNLALPVLIPVILVLFLSAKKVPTVLGLGISAIVSMIFAVVFQHVNFTAVLQAGYAGVTSKTGVALVDNILSRGGIKSMTDTIVTIMLACTMGAALSVSSASDVIVEKFLLKKIKSYKGLVMTNMLYCYMILLMSGSQILGVILGAKTFEKSYEEMDVHAKVMTRTLEDTNTIGAPLVPWSGPAAYITAVLGVGINYIPYMLLGYTVPIFSIICALTGFGIWRRNGKVYYGRSNK